MAKKLMAILAHPDDESLGNGGMLAKYAAEGIEIHLVVATRGERGWPGKESEYPGLETLGKLREAEVRAAANVLGLHSVYFLVSSEEVEVWPTVDGVRASNWATTA